jgi:hypothetical protein
MRARETTLTGEVNNVVDQFSSNAFIGTDNRDGGLRVSDENLHGIYFLSSLKCFPQPCDYIIA